MISLRYILIEILEIIMINNYRAGLICMFFGYKKLNTFKLVNRAVEGLEKNRSK